MASERINVPPFDPKSLQNPRTLNPYRNNNWGRITLTIGVRSVARWGDRYTIIVRTLSFVVRVHESLAGGQIL